MRVDLRGGRGVSMAKDDLGVFRGDAELLEERGSDVARRVNLYTADAPVGADAVKITRSRCTCCRTWIAAVASRASCAISMRRPWTRHPLTGTRSYEEDGVA